MKIALTGAHGVGKSTLANALKTYLEQTGNKVLITPEVPRLICEILNDDEFFRRGKNSLLKQSAVLLGQLIIEETKPNSFDYQICDRTLFDHWAYTINQFGEEITKENIKDLFESFIKKHCETYDKIFYIPIEFDPIDDGVREDDIKFQKEIDNLIYQLLTTHKLSFKTISGSVEKRKESILKALLNN